MGYALAQAAIEAGAAVTLISGPTALTPPGQVRFIPVETTQQMYDAVSTNFDKCDCLIMAAAPSDFTPVETASQKIKKGTGRVNLMLKPTVDILKSLKGRKRAGQLVVGFALETENGIVNATAKLFEKNLDLIILNETNLQRSAFDSDTNRVTLIRAGAEPEVWEEMSKLEISANLLDIVAELL